MLHNTNLIGFAASRPRTIGGNDANTLLLLHFDGTNGGTTFTDSSASARTVSVSGAGPTTSTSYAKFGTASGLFTGSNYISVPDSAAFVLGANPFAIDFWMKSSTSSPLCGQSYFVSGADFQYSIQLQGNAGSIQVSGGSGPQDATLNFTSSSATYFDGNPHHVELNRVGNVFTLYKDGVADGSQTTAITLMDSAQTWKIGRSNGWGADFTGNLDEFRISNVARHTGNFTPPTGPYT